MLLCAMQRLGGHDIWPL